MSKKKNIFTKEGYEKLSDELEHLKNIVRLDIAKKLNEATEFGDLSENAAYHTAMEERDLNEGKIAELEEILANAKVVKGTKGNGEVGMGSKVVLESSEGSKLDFEIVGMGETDLVAKKFNAESPLVSAVMGKKKGEMVSIKLRDVIVQYTIISVK